MSQQVKITRRLVTVVFLATVTLTVPALAAVTFNGQTGITAYGGGKPLYPSDAGCFHDSYGGVVNSCTSTKTWEISIPSTFSWGTSDSSLGTQYSGSIKFKALPFLPGSCWVAVTTDARTPSVWWSANAQFFPSGNQIDIPRIVADAANLYCDIPPNGMVSHVVLQQSRILY